MHLHHMGHGNLGKYRIIKGAIDQEFILDIIGFRRGGKKVYDGGNRPDMDIHLKFLKKINKDSKSMINLDT